MVDKKKKKLRKYILLSKKKIKVVFLVAKEKTEEKNQKNFLN